MESTPDMTLKAFYELYKKDIAKKVYITIQCGKQQIIETKNPLPGREEARRHHAVRHPQLAERHPISAHELNRFRDWGPNYGISATPAPGLALVAA